MNPQTQPKAEDFFNADYEDVRQWCELFSNPYFEKVIKKVNNEIDVCNKNIEKLSLTPSLDNSIALSIEVGSKEKFKKLLRYFDFVRDKKLQLDKELANRKAINASV